MIRKVFILPALLLSLTAAGQGRYDVLIQNQGTYIRGLQLADGAIMDNGQAEANGTYRITPYNGNLAAIGLLANPTADNIAAVKYWIQWYLRHLNGTDGFINDYYTPSPQDTSHYTTQKYDSMDSYAATFLSLIRKFGALSAGNTTWLKKNSLLIEQIAGALNSCIQVNALSIEAPGDLTYFTMDNAEVNKALQDIQWLTANQILKTGLWAQKLKNNTYSFEKLWNAKTGTYNFALNDTSRDWTSFYPFGTAQFFPVIYGMINPSTTRAVTLWKQFNSHYAGWVNGDVLTPDSSAWSAMVYASVIMKDDIRANKYLGWYQGYLAGHPGQQFPYWTDAVAAFVIMAAVKEN